MKMNCGTEVLQWKNQVPSFWEDTNNALISFILVPCSRHGILMELRNYNRKLFLCVCHENDDDDDDDDV